MEIDSGTAALAALFSGALAAGVTKLFDRRKDGAEVADIVQGTYSGILADLTTQLDAQAERTRRTQAEAEEKCQRQITEIRDALMLRITYLERELDEIRATGWLPGSSPPPSSPTPGT